MATGENQEHCQTDHEGVSVKLYTYVQDKTLFLYASGISHIALRP